MTDLITSSFLPLLCCCFPCFRSKSATKQSQEETDEQALAKAAEWRKRLSRREEDMAAAGRPSGEGGLLAGGRSRGNTVGSAGAAGGGGGRSRSGTLEPHGGTRAGGGAEMAEKRHSRHLSATTATSMNMVPMSRWRSGGGRRVAWLGWMRMDRLRA
ncbi:uncharacterized protein AB675_2338 [Cyphellophora attinorum]|uniref:Uncharacterized protein n=1 Tax=Cyphellophora attinorum TaxID=1664694 RepID=A0A0N1P268_9EURO|nr:uncharacterized protein AB675_2338 [Phialophora attinorum]KPI45023.1 hypothetical protein AB675_2338 [Phialophora attinorum]